MDLTAFEDERGKLVWSLPDDIAQRLSQTPQEKLGDVVDLLQKSLGILCYFILQSFTNQHLAQHLPAFVNIMGDVVIAAEVKATQQQQGQQGGQQQGNWN